MILLTIILSAASTVVSQTPAPERVTDRRPAATPPAGSDRTVGKAPVTPKNLPPGLHQILEVKYIDTLPGAQVKIKNVGGLQLEKSGLTMRLVAIDKTDPASAGMGKLFSKPLQVGCPFNSALGRIYVQTAVPPVKAGEAITMNIRFQHKGLDFSTKGRT